MNNSVVISHIISKWVIWVIVLILLLTIFIVFSCIKSIRRYRWWTFTLLALMTIYVSVPTIQGVMDIKNGSYITEYVEYYRSDESNTRNSLVASESIQITLNDGTTLILKGARKDLPYGRHTGYVTYAERSKVIIEFTQQDSQ